MQTLTCTVTETITHLASKLSAQRILQKIWDSNGDQLLCVFLANDFRWHLSFSASQCM